MKIALIQTKQNELYNFINPNTSFSRERALELQNEMLEQFFTLANRLETDCDLIVTSEAINFCGEGYALPGEYASYIPGYPEDEIFARLGKVAAKKGAWMVAGVYNRRVTKDGEQKCYNSAVIYNRQGELVALYDKIHLTDGEKENLTAGSSAVVVETDMGKMGVVICFDMQFPDVCRKCKEKGAKFMAVPTWGWESSYGYQRIREIQIPVIETMAVPYWMEIEGERRPSAVIDQNCRILAEGSRDKAEIIYGWIY